jgi:hypothetical protein
MPLADQLRAFVDAVSANDRHGSVKSLLSLNSAASNDRGAELRQVLARQQPLAALLTVALKGAASIPTVKADDLRQLRNYSGIGGAR